VCDPWPLGIALPDLRCLGIGMTLWRTESEALLAVDKEPTRNGGCVVFCSDIDHRTYEVTFDLRVASNPNDVVPKLLAVLCSPAVIALEDRNDELLCPLQQIGYQSVFSLHVFALMVLPDAQGEPTSTIRKRS
jgi:hypothetical protein